MLAEARVEVGVADHKASMVLAALGIGFGALAGGLLARDWEPSDMHGGGEVLWWMGALAAIASVAAAGSAVWPRYKTSDAADGIYYWGHVATFKTEQAFRDALASVPPTRDDRTLHQLWHLSGIVRKKYRRVRAAMALSALAVSLFLLASLAGG